jgi:glycosyltransferase involved in cell wall biosynthesis
VRICLVYDCLFPHTVGGAERWYRNLAERLASDGHQVTYLTLRQWNRGADPGLDGVDVRSVGPQMRLYTSPGRRRILPPLVFGTGVLLHLLRHGRRYDVVHTASFPYFSLLAAAAVRPAGNYRLVVDWHEVWTRDYWLEYLGPLGGRIGWFVQTICLRITQTATCFSQLHARRLHADGIRGGVIVLPGEYVRSAHPIPDSRRSQTAGPLVVYAGRHIPEKRVPAIVPALAEAGRQIPGLRGIILGDGPERGQVLRAIDEYGIGESVQAPGFVESDTVEGLLAEALCLLLPSRREGYGLVVIEAASHGTPSIVVASADNAAVELISDGENGVVAPSASASDLAAAIVRIHSAPRAMREGTSKWFSRNVEQLSIEASLDLLTALYKKAEPETSGFQKSGNLDRTQPMCDRPAYGDRSER